MALDKNKQISEDDVTYFAMTNYRSEQRKFGIKLNDRRKHMYIIGKTGMGKTTLLENMAVSDIKKGHGLAFVDPHGETAEKLLNYIPSSRVNDVVYFNPADTDYPIAFNIMESVEEKYRNVVADGLVNVFKKIWADSWGPRLEYILRNAILALLENPGNTLLGVTRMLVDPAYRKKIVKNIKDPVVKSFWTQEYPGYSEKLKAEAISPIQNKVGQFLANSMIRNILGQPKSTVNMEDVMNERKILILNLSKGRIGEDASHLLGAMFITKIQVAAMSRARIKPEERKDFFLYVDEFQNFATESFAGILSEARKYRLNLIIAHQYIGQLSTTGSTVVRDAVFGNVGTIINFRVGAQDAEFLVKEFEPIFTENDLVNLPFAGIYLKLMIDGVASDAFSANTLPPLFEPEGLEETVIKVSRERHSKKRELVEERIMKWSDVGDSSSEKFTEKPRNNAYKPNNFRGQDAKPKPSNSFADKRPVSIAKKDIPTAKGVSLASAIGQHTVDFRGKKQANDFVAPPRMRPQERKTFPKKKPVINKVNTPNENTPEIELLRQKGIL